MIDEETLQTFMDAEEGFDDDFVDPFDFHLLGLTVPVLIASGNLAIDIYIESKPATHGV